MKTDRVQKIQEPGGSWTILFSRALKRHPQVRSQRASANTNGAWACLSMSDCQPHIQLGQLLTCRGLLMQVGSCVASQACQPASMHSCLASGRPQSPASLSLASPRGASMSDLPGWRVPSMSFVLRTRSGWQEANPNQRHQVKVRRQMMHQLMHECLRSDRCQPFANDLTNLHAFMVISSPPNMLAR